MAQNERISAAADANAIRTSSQLRRLTGFRAAILEKDTALAAANNNVLQLTAGQKSTSDALGAMQKANDMQNQQMADLRKANLDLQKRDSENSLALVAMNNKFDTVNRQWRDQTEMNTELQNQLRGANETMKRTGVNNNSPTINPEPMGKVAGVIRTTETVNGVKMATISVGSADQVTKGMRFAVIDRYSADPFLGYLTVDKIDQNSAIGTLAGPRVDQIHAGVEVKTQLQ